MELVDLTTAINSDHYVNIVLTTMLKKQDLNDEAFKKLVSRVGQCQSDHYATQILVSALITKNLNSARIMEVLKAATN